MNEICLIICNCCDGNGTKGNTKTNYKYFVNRQKMERTSSDEVVEKTSSYVHCTYIKSKDNKGRTSEYYGKEDKAKDQLWIVILEW